MKESETSSLAVAVLPAAPEQEPVLANLLELYAHDFSEFFALQIGADGRYGYQSLPLYWSEANRFPFLVRVNGALAGFVLLQQGSQVSDARDIWDVAEFFVLRGYRRQGVGLKVAHQLWRMFAGAWEVRVAARNLVAHSFWQHAISSFTCARAEAGLTDVAGQSWRVFSFSSKATAKYNCGNADRAST